MSFRCRDLEGVLKEGNRELPKSLLEHAATCPSCRAELQSWDEISAVARSMRKTWDSPHLWPRINRALDGLSMQSAHTASRKVNWFPRAWAKTWPWKPAAAGFFMLILCLMTTWSLLNWYQPERREQKRLLTEQALQEVEATEQAYARSIEKLSRLVPSLDPHPESPLRASYKEKLMLLDTAIADCRSHLEFNRFNAHLRRELLFLYQEKQRTLQEMLKEENHATN